jgi:hypothetical protein
LVLKREVIFCLILKPYFLSTTAFGLAKNLGLGSGFGVGFWTTVFGFEAGTIFGDVPVLTVATGLTTGAGTVSLMVTVARVCVPRVPRSDALVNWT